MGFKDFQDTMALRDSQMGRMVYPILSFCAY